jgi:hypothetical protein
MSRNQEKVSASGIIILILVMLNVIILKTAFIHDARIYWGLVITLPLLLIAIFDTLKRKRVIRSAFRQLKTPSALWILRVKTLLRKNKVSDGKTVETQITSLKKTQK